MENRLFFNTRKNKKMGAVYKFLLNNRAKETIIRNFFVTLGAYYVLMYMKHRETERIKTMT